MGKVIDLALARWQRGLEPARSVSRAPTRNQIVDGVLDRYGGHLRITNRPGKARALAVEAARAAIRALSAQNLYVYANSEFTFMALWDKGQFELRLLVSHIRNSSALATHTPLMSFAPGQPLQPTIITMEGKIAKNDNAVGLVKLPMSEFYRL